MAEKYLLFNLEDEKSKKLGEVISNETCKKIVNSLAEKEMSETEISQGLGIPLNTVEYNLKKLIEAGIIEKSKHWWSVKGKKIETYKVVNKIILIAPKKTMAGRFKTFLPVLIISAVFSLFIFWNNFIRTNSTFSENIDASKGLTDTATSGAANMVAGAANTVAQTSQPVFWMWFLTGIWLVILGFIIYSVVKRN